LIAIFIFSRVTRPQHFTSLSPYTTLFRSVPSPRHRSKLSVGPQPWHGRLRAQPARARPDPYLWKAGEPGSLETRRPIAPPIPLGDRKSTRLNFSHVSISYAVFCWQKNDQH